MSWDSESKSQISISTEATTVDKEPEYYERWDDPSWPHVPFYDPIRPKLNRRCPIKQAKIDKRKATREEHLKTWLNALGQKSNSLYSFDICDEPTTEAGFQNDIIDGAVDQFNSSQRDFKFKDQFENPPKGKGITLEGFTISIHQHYIKEKGGLLRNDQWRIHIFLRSVGLYTDTRRF